MKKLLVILIAICFHAGLLAQDAAKLQETAKAYMRSGDHANAILVLNRAMLLQPNNVEIAKDLGLNYYFSKDYKKSLEVYKALIEKDIADDQCFQIAGDAYQALEQTAEAEKLYKKGIKRFPNSGVLYNELGELQWAKGDYTAIKQWEKGIEADPGYHKNYYNASKYYYFTKDKVWSIIYGEVYLNMDPQGALTPEVKNLLLEGYKKLFADADLEKNNTDKNNFTIAFLKTMNKQTSVAGNGITAETLTMIRSRFILDWYANYATKFPFKLFELQRQLLQDGIFDAYNQWIFGAAQNLPAYQNWTTAHASEYNELIKFQKNRVFKIPAGQYYH